MATKTSASAMSLKELVSVFLSDLGSEFKVLTGLSENSALLTEFEVAFVFHFELLL